MLQYSIFEHEIDWHIERGQSRCSRVCRRIAKLGYFIDVNPINKITKKIRGARKTINCLADEI